MKHCSVFLDTEFTDFVNMDLISIGLVTANGEEFYGENLSFNQSASSEFVRDIVYPLLKPLQFGKPRSELSASLWEWIDELPYDQITMMLDYQKDYDLLINLLGEVHPKFLWTSNIFSMFTAEAIMRNGVDKFRPMATGLREVFDKESAAFYSETEFEHHALSDAKSNKYGFNAAMKTLGPKFAVGPIQRTQF